MPPILLARTLDLVDRRSAKTRGERREKWARGKRVIAKAAKRKVASKGTSRVAQAKATKTADGWTATFEWQTFAQMRREKRVYKEAMWRDVTSGKKSHEELRREYSLGLPTDGELILGEDLE